MRLSGDVEAINTIGKFAYCESHGVIEGANLANIEVVALVTVLRMRKL